MKDHSIFYNPTKSAEIRGQKEGVFKVVGAIPNSRNLRNSWTSVYLLSLNLVSTSGKNTFLIANYTDYMDFFWIKPE